MTIMQVDLIELSRIEQRTLALYHKIGIIGLAALVTAVSAFSTVTMTVVASMLLIEDFTWKRIMPELSMALGIPFIISPVISIVITSILVKLDVAYQEATKLSTTDPLTGSTNRRGFISAASQNIHTFREATHSKVGMVGMVDLDKFKQINDTHGHAIGDDALSAIAKRMEAQIADDGIVGRLGGDEFAFIAIAPQAKLTDLKHRLLEHCTQFDLTDEIEICCSIGMVMLEPNETIDEALARADKSLYKIKQSRPKDPMDHSRAA